MMLSDKTKLKQAINQIAQLQTEKKSKDDEINEAVALAAEKFELNKRTIKALAKDTRSNEMERAERRLQEEELDQCRAALGLLADLPLGEAAVAEVAASTKNGKARGKQGRKPTTIHATHEGGTA